MDFVTKKEYESAIEIITRAVLNGQLALINQEDALHITAFMFIQGFDSYSVNAASFISPEQAIKARLFEVRKELKRFKEESNCRQKSLDSLESEEKKLMAKLPTVKE